MNFPRQCGRMFLRDLRAREFNLLFAAILVAVAALASVGFLADRVGQGLEREAGQLLGGDLLLEADHPWDSRIAAEARREGLAVNPSILFNSMVGSARDAMLVGVKAVEAPYPLRGSMRIAAAPDTPDQEAGRVPAPGEIWLDERAYARLGVAVGDTVELGLLKLRVGALLAFESDRGANFFSLLPRVVVNLADLPASGLLVEGSRATWRLHFAGSAPQAAAFTDWVKPRLGRGESLESIDNARPELRTALDQAQRFLRLAALLAVILAAVAIGLSSRRFMLRHLDACAVMRCLGASGRRIQGIVVGEFLLLGLAASLAGLALGALIQWLLADLLAASVGVPLAAPGWSPLGQGLAVGLVLVVGFALPQVLRLGRVPALILLRRDALGMDRRSNLAWVLGAAALGGLILWIAREPRLAAWVGLGFAAALAAYALFAALAVVSLAGLRGRVGRGWRYGLAALCRRFAASVIQASALGLGLTALLLLTLVRGDLTSAWRHSVPPDAPNRFVINIQPDQGPAVRAFFAKAGLAEPELSPMIRGRLVGIDGRPVNPDAYAELRTRHLVEREFNLSYATALPGGNRIEAGRWHGSAVAPAFSVEAGIAKRLGLKVGDRLTFEVAGQRVEAPITSLRTLDWDSMRVNFFVVSSPELLDHQPASLITSFHLPQGHADFTRDLVGRFPNLTMIDVGAILAQLQGLMERLARVVQFVFGFALLAGLVVMYAALQSTHDEREYEIAMLRTLGARDAQIRQALATEFAALGLLAGVLAGVGAAGIGWGLALGVFHLADYWPSTLALALGPVLGIVGVLAGGWLGVRGLLRTPPMRYLRGAE